MDTKERILNSALHLYNKEGIHAITSRHIATEMGISAGNLHYHFRHTDDIIKALYDQLSTEFDDLMLQTESMKDLDISNVDEFTSLSFRIIYKYRFIFLHFVEIARRIPAIRRDYLKLTERRTAQFSGIFHQLVKNGVFRSDLPADVWPYLVKQIFIVADFWLSNNELTNRLSEKKALTQFTETFQMMFLPYLVTTPASRY